MGKTIEIQDISQPEIRIFYQLTEAQLRNRIEPEKGIFIAESPKVIQTALASGCEPVAMLTERRHIAGDAREIIKQCGDIPIYTGDSDLLANITGYRLTRGVLCAMRRPILPSVEDVCRGQRRIVVMDNVVDATNVGAIFRSAAALGIGAVLLSPTCCDALNRRTVRVSMGSVFLIPWTYIGTHHTEWPQPGIQRIKDLGFKTVAMTLSNRAIPLDDETLRREEKLAIIMGTEGDGLSHSTINACDYNVIIPMQHGVDSLNVAAASAVAFWQLR